MIRETRLHPESVGATLANRFEKRLNELVEMDIAPTPEMPGHWFMAKHKLHASHRLGDGLWHYYRYADATRAEQEDLRLAGPMLPKAKQ